MSDRVVGVAVLCRTSDRSKGVLYMRCRYESSGDVFDCDLPVCESDHDEPGFWAFRVVGDTMHVHPSVKMDRPGNGGTWHNDFSWSVRFVEWSRQGSPFAQLREVNAPTGERMHD